MCLNLKLFYYSLIVMQEYKYQKLLLCLIFPVAVIAPLWLNDAFTNGKPIPVPLNSSLFVASRWNTSKNPVFYIEGPGNQ